jgi:hypothetical protein
MFASGDAIDRAMQEAAWICSDPIKRDSQTAR